MTNDGGAGPSRRPEEVESLVTLNRALLAQQLLRGIAHDIRNNLQVVALGSSLGEDGAGTPISIRVERSLDEMVRALDLLSSLGRVTINEPPVCELTEILSAIDELAALQRNLPTLRVRIERPAAPTRVAIPRSELVQILLNLLANAKEAQSRPDEQVEVITTIPMDGRIAILVDDRGPGVPVGAGTPLYTTKDPAFHGGLGLFVGRELATRRGGELGWEARPGGGSRVRLVLPISDRG